MQIEEQARKYADIAFPVTKQDVLDNNDKATNNEMAYICFLAGYYASKWIDVEEPPKESGDVIALEKGGSVTPAYFKNQLGGIFYRISDTFLSDPLTVTHWQPLPEAIK